jgi:predicted nucleic acid-binding protein
MTGPCFVDANVVVYALDPRDQRKHRLASEWIDVLWRDRLGRMSAQVIAEAYSAATRKLGMAPRWDSLIVAAAQAQDCVLLLTEDLQDGAVFGAVTVRSPFTLQLSEAAALYKVERRGVALHRARGRPKQVAVTFG